MSEKDNMFREVAERLLKRGTENYALTVLKGCSPIEYKEKRLVLGVPGEHAALYLKKNLLDKIKSTLKEITGNDVSVKIEVKRDIEQSLPLMQEEPTQSKPGSKPDINSARKKSNLNEMYRFSNLVRGVTNEYAVGVAYSISKSPGTKYNPLFIYGGVGLGKTHIVQAIGNEILEADTAKRVHYVAGEIFRNEYIEGLMLPKGANFRQMNKFKAKYHNLDVLILDDLQMLQKAEQSSVELFEIFRALDSAGKQMVFVSDKRPKDLQNIDSRLINRFERGLIIEIQPPDFETRVAIIRLKLEDMNTSMDEGVISLIAESITTDVRRINGAITTYLSHRDILGVEMSVAECVERGIFADYFTKSSISGARVKDIIKAVSKHYDVPVKIILSKDRSKFVARARQVAMYLSCELTEKSQTEIGLEFNRNHATVTHAKQAVQKELTESPSFENDFEQIKEIMRQEL